jgi:hypothetical protein
MLITRVLANALALKAAYDDLPPNEAKAATRWKRIVDATCADFEARKTDRAREGALAKDTVLIALSIS